MTLMDVKLKTRNYKCFGADPQGFDSIRAANLIVGRNNSGKSALVDLIERACGFDELSGALYHKSQTPQFLLSKKLVESELRHGFHDNTSGGAIGQNHWHYGRKFVDAEITVEIKGKQQLFSGIQTDEEYERGRDNLNEVAAVVQNPFKGKSFRRLVADRDIVAEQDAGELRIEKNGRGFTNTIQRYLNKSFLPSSVIEQGLLNALNEVFSPDALFTAIEVQQHKDGMWEVFLEEGKKGRIALSQSGSGLKTVLLVLSFIVLLPAIESKKISEFIFAFEELENNLHPALQRRLIKFIRDSAVEKKFLVFMTSHSNAIIDLLSKDSEAQIMHVTHDGQVAKARHVQTYYDNHGILDDLDVRASDLLQSNAVVWVEGPSDRLYFNRWLALRTQGALQEGAHYQCVSYGGRLLAHLSAEAPFLEDDAPSATNILRVNRNAIILIDSDKRSRNTSLNDTKRRILAELNDIKGMAWVTKGREVENYIPTVVLQKLYPQLRKPLGPYDHLAEFLERLKKGEGQRFSRNKVLFAERLLPLIEAEDLDSVLDLNEKILEASILLARWNGVEVSWT